MKTKNKIKILVCSVLFFSLILSFPASINADFFNNNTQQHQQQNNMQNNWGNDFQSNYNNAFQGDWGMDKGISNENYSGQFKDNNFGFDRQDMSSGFNDGAEQEFSNFKQNFNNTPDVSREWDKQGAKNNFDSMEQGIDNNFQDKQNNFQSGFDDFADNSPDGFNSNMDIQSELNDFSNDWDNDLMANKNDFEQGFGDIQNRMAGFEGNIPEGNGSLDSKIPEFQQENPFADEQFLNISFLNDDENENEPANFSDHNTNQNGEDLSWWEKGINFFTGGNNEVSGNNNFWTTGD